MAETDKKECEWPDEDQVIYVPDKYVRDIENSLEKMETARKEFYKVAESVKPELRIEN
jgi:hypothetical protein